MLINHYCLSAFHCSVQFFFVKLCTIALKEIFLGNETVISGSPRGGQKKEARRKEETRGREETSREDQAFRKGKGKKQERKTRKNSQRSRQRTQAQGQMTAVT